MSHFTIMKLILLELLMLISCAYAANILCIFPMPAYSHQQPALTLSRALASKGHNLTVINAYPSKVPIKNHRDIDISFLYKEMHSPNFLEETQFSIQTRTSGFDLADVLPKMMKFLNSRLYDSAIMQDFIREVNGTKFDLIIYEPMHITSVLGFADLVGNPPTIALWTSHRLSPLDKTIGNPIIPSYMPASFLPFNNHMTFWERFKNFVFELYFNYVTDYKTAVMNENFMHKNFGNVNRKLLQLEHNTSLYIITTDLVTAYVHPIQPSIVYVGPLHIKQPSDPLPADIQKWMDEAEDGVIYFSLGSNMKGTSVPESIRGAFIKSFKQFPKIRVLWKWESDERLPGQPDNVLVKKWLPQQSVLAHPKTCLFISQVGQQSFDEATYYGVPILGVPMFFDQDSNAGKVVSAGVGLKIEFNSIRYDNLHGLIKELLSNNSYKENMRRLSAVIKDKPMSSVNTAIWWVEYILRHKGALHLRPAALDLTWYQYYLVDILLCSVISVLAIVYLFYFIVRQLLRIISLVSPKTQVNKEKCN